MRPTAAQYGGKEHYSTFTTRTNRWGSTPTPGGSELTKKSETSTIIRRQGGRIPIVCERCQEQLGLFTGKQVGSNELPRGAVSSIVVKPSWSAHLCSRADGDICTECGGVCGDPEPTDLNHPYYSCYSCAGGS